MLGLRTRRCSLRLNIPNLMMPAIPSVLRPSHLPTIEFQRPVDLDELLCQVKGGAHPLAGGTDIVVWASQRGQPNRLAWTGGIDQLHDFDDTASLFRISAAVTLSRILRSERFRRLAPAVADGAAVIGSVQLRNQATLIGNICTASPGGDTIPGLHVHEAKVQIVGHDNSRRSVEIKDFVRGPGDTNLEEGELVVDVTFDSLNRFEGSAFRRFTQRNALDLAVASVAVRIGLENDRSTVSELHLSLGAVGPTVIDIADAGTLLIGRPLETARLQDCGDIAAEQCMPISDHRASADYRRQLVRTLTVDVVQMAAKRATTELSTVETF